MNLKAMAVITGLTLATGLNFPILAASNHLIASNLDQTTSSLNSAIAQTQKPTDAMSSPNHTGDSMKKPTGAMSTPNPTGDAMKKPAGNTMKKPVSGAMSNPNSTGDAMKKPAGDAMTKPKG
jgi:hypothetical protein